LDLVCPVFNSGTKGAQVPMFNACLDSVTNKCTEFRLRFITGLASH
jgi:hypothetical protein